MRDIVRGGALICVKCGTRVRMRSSIYCPICIAVNLRGLNAGDDGMQRNVRWIAKPSPRKLTANPNMDRPAKVEHSFEVTYLLKDGIRHTEKFGKEDETVAKDRYDGLALSRTPGLQFRSMVKGKWKTIPPYDGYDPS